ncbi:MAG: flagellar biosynthetic protein FliR [Candidatus Accumulibacter necessarius]|jgi:flagellar biosynthetic protein FliR|uniref:flagellar biosynthetic protein FliR n=1 Tax=Candidatus Accumulibacter necessarius TaxID=2954386 RepID=UPI002FC37E9F
MISLTSAEINAWIVAFFFPLARVLAVLVSAPPFNNPALTVRVSGCSSAWRSPWPSPRRCRRCPLDPASGAGLLILAQQMLIGFAMGFAMRLVLSAVDLAGSMISLQMGLGFASSPTTRRPPVRPGWSRSSWGCWRCWFSWPSTAT